MAQFKCEICGEEFEQKSRYERHMTTSHPQQAVSAADIEKALQGTKFPKSKEELLSEVEEKSQDERVRDIIKQLPEKEYRDAAEVSQAFGELRSHEEKSDAQPSKLGGEKAMKSPSAARIASLFEGANFPASGKDLKALANDKAKDDEKAVIENINSSKTFKSMSDVTKEISQNT